MERYLYASTPWCLNTGKTLLLQRCSKVFTASSNQTQELIFGFMFLVRFKSSFLLAVGLFSPKCESCHLLCGLSGLILPPVELSVQSYRMLRVTRDCSIQSSLYVSLLLFLGYHTDASCLCSSHGQPSFLTRYFLVRSFQQFAILP